MTTTATERHLRFISCAEKGDRSGSITVLEDRAGYTKNSSALTILSPLMKLEITALKACSRLNTGEQKRHDSAQTKRWLDDIGDFQFDCTSETTSQLGKSTLTCCLSTAASSTSSSTTTSSHLCFLPLILQCCQLGRGSPINALPHSSSPVL